MGKYNEINARFNKEGLNKWLVGQAAGSLIFLAEHLIRTKIKGRENLLEAASFVNSGSMGLLVTPNHESYIDAIIMNLVRKDINLDKIFKVFWANKFTGKDKGKYAATGQEDKNKVKFAGKIGKKASEMIGIELVDTPQEAENAGVALATARLMDKVAEETLGANGVLGIFPEGTRSRDGMLNEVKRGMIFLFRRQNIKDKTIILPVGVVGTGNYMSPDSEKINPFAQITISYGKPYSYAQAREEAQRHKLPIEVIMMWHIAKLLPEAKWGVYRETFQKIKSAESYR